MRVLINHLWLFSLPFLFSYSRTLDTKTDLSAPAGLAIETGNRTALIGKRVYGPDDEWTTYAKKGKKLWRTWQLRSGPDSRFPFQAAFRDGFRLRFKASKLDMYLRGLYMNMEEKMLRRLGYTNVNTRFSASYTASESSGSQRPLFQGTFGVGEGIICVTGSWRTDCPYHLSQVLWWIWQEAVQVEHPDWLTNPQGVLYSHLKSIWVFDVANEATTHILDKMFAGRDRLQNSMMTFKPNNCQLGDPFFALLGTPNAVAFIHLLIERKEASGGVGIVELNVLWSAKDVHYSIWADYGHDESLKFNPKQCECTECTCGQGKCETCEQGECGRGDSGKCECEAGKCKRCDCKDCGCDECECKPGECEKCKDGDCGNGNCEECESGFQPANGDNMYDEGQLMWHGG